MPCGGSQAVDGVGGRRVRQRAVRVILRDAGVRVARSPPLRDRASGTRRRVCVPYDFVISDIQWTGADDLRCPMHDATESTCASRIPSGARWSARSQPNIPSPHADPPFPKPSVTWWSLTPAPCSGLRSRGRRCATHRAASRTGSAGAWRERFVLPHPADASRVHEAPHYQIHWPRRVPQAQTRPRNRGSSTRTVAALRARPSSNRRPRGLWTLPGLPVLWTRKRTRAHSPLDAGKRTPAPTAPWKTGQTAGRFSTSVHRPSLRPVSLHGRRSHIPAA